MHPALALVVLAGDVEFANRARGIIIDLPHLIDCGFELVKTGLKSTAISSRDVVLPGRVKKNAVLGVQRRDAGRILLAEAIHIGGNYLADFLLHIIGRCWSRKHKRDAQCQ